MTHPRDSVGQQFDGRRAQSGGGARDVHLMNLEAIPGGRGAPLALRVHL